MKTKTLLYTLVLSSVLFAAIPAVYAKVENVPNGFRIDQRSDETTGNQFALWDNLDMFAPMGQTFIPSAGSDNQEANGEQKLVGIEIYIVGGYNYPDEGDFLMEILEDGPDGLIIASQEFSAPVNVSGWVYVRFSPPVRLTPGRTYAFLVWLVPGQQNFWGLISDGRSYVSTYPFGCWVLWGKIRPGGNDLAFRTYILKSSN